MQFNQERLIQLEVQELSTVISLYTHSNVMLNNNNNNNVADVLPSAELLRCCQLRTGCVIIGILGIAYNVVTAAISGYSFIANDVCRSDQCIHNPAECVHSTVVHFCMSCG